MTIGKEPCNCGPCAAARDADRRRSELSYKDWTEAMLLNVGAVAPPERVDLALRLVALVEAGWGVQRCGYAEGFGHVRLWRGGDCQPDTNWAHWHNTLEAAVAAAEASEKGGGDGE